MTPDPFYPSVLARAFAVLCLLFVAACGALPGGSDLQDKTVLTDVPVSSTEMLSLLNAYRQQNGLPPLRHDPRLDQVSQGMAQHIAKRDSMDTWQHSAFGLSSRLEKADYPNYAGAENLGAGYADLGAAFRGWQGSSGHNKNLLNPYVTRVGIARTNRNTGTWRNFWVMTLSRPVSDGRPG
ncbi:CAP domain-containing protein [Roseibium denhamense]|uniref:Cysteine-rich secretory protein family protein n=1 Tax=Roseibium denhamense TaxID=76305 RepID=A0ABY1NQF5_9HYPH|nr:CAP domain-containing protein [Roseibium denhamense]MTI08002.1 CAP domain-containing protein [Roseibium denhamense]SMP15574.1 Cysteine-rich secretory protein family protein [Roseibium denhamense]